MSTNGTGVDAATDAAATGEEPRQQPSVVERVTSMPLISSACDMVSATYALTKDSHPHVKAVCDSAERGVRVLTAAAASGAQPVLTRLEAQIASASELAHKGLDKLEGNLPILQQPTDQVLADTKELVSSKVSGAREMVSSTVSSAKDSVATRVTGAVDATRSAVSSGVQSVMGSRMGQMVLSGVDTVLGKSEAWMDNHLPMTDAELAGMATALEGPDGPSVQEQRRQQSYFVRLGALSERLRERAFAHSLAKLRDTGRRAHDALQQLTQALSLMEAARQGVDQRLLEGQERLQQMWQSWGQRSVPDTEAPQAQGTPETQGTPQAQETTETPQAQGTTETPPEVEARALSGFRLALQQGQAACAALGSSLQGLPAHVREHALQARRQLEELQAAFAGVHAFRDLPAAVLAQSRERVAGAREALDRVVEHVAQNAPLTWLVGPFAPGIAERAPDK